jgi:hypothetical protein
VDGLAYRPRYTRFCYRLSEAHGLLRLEGFGKLIEFIYIIGSRSRDLYKLGYDENDTHHLKQEIVFVSSIRGKRGRESYPYQT